MSQNYLQVGQTATFKVERANFGPTPSQLGQTGGTSSGRNSTYVSPIPITTTGGNYLSTQTSSGAPITISSSANRSSSPNIMPITSTSPMVISSNYQPSSSFFGKAESTTGGRSAKDFLLGNNFESKAEANNMRRSQQLMLGNLGSASAMRDEIGGGKFDTKITRDRDVFHSNYVNRDIGRERDTLSGLNLANAQFTNFQYLAELERNLGELRMEANNLKRQAMSSERQTSQMTKELEYLQDENGRLRSDLHKLEQTRTQLDETTLELDRMKSDRDFHNEQHLNLRKEILEIVKQEYELDSLKREKQFLEGELKNYKEKSVIYEKQIDELTILAKRPVSKNQGDGSDKQEHYYAKKILELENKLKEMKKQADDLRHENSNFKAGVKDLDASRITDMGFRATTPDSLLEQVNLLKKTNQTLKKENEIIRRELKNATGGISTGATSSMGGDADGRIKELQKQIEQLTRKNIKLEEENMLSGGGNGGNAGLEVLELRMQLDAANNAIAKLRANGMNNSLLGDSMKPSSDYEKKMQNIVSDYLDQINQLRQENEELRSGGASFGGGGDARLAKLKIENEELRRERDRLREKIQELQATLEYKNKEIEVIKTSSSGMPDSEALLKVMETNQRLVSELSKLQDAMRKMENSMNMSLTAGGGNNSMLPYSQFMMP